MMDSKYYCCRFDCSYRLSILGDIFLMALASLCQLGKILLLQGDMKGYIGIAEGFPVY